MVDPSKDIGLRLPLLLRRPLVQSVLALAVLLSHGWMTTLEFQLDDFEQIADAADPGSPAVLLGRDDSPRSAMRGHRTMVSFFRPVLHATFVVEVAIFGADPFALHAMSLFWHLLVVLMFRRVMRRLLLRSNLEPRRERIELWSFLAALLVAVHPGTWGAVSWIAARGDVLSALFFLVALDLLAEHRERPRRALPPLVFLALLAGLLAKEGALVAPVLVAAIDWLVLRRREAHLNPLRTWPIDLAMVLMAPAYLLFRRWFFGDQADFYAGYERIVTWEILARMVADIAPTFGMLTGGSFHEAGGSLGAILRSILATMLLFVPIPWLLRRPLRRSLFVAFAFALYLIAAAAPLRFFEEASGFDASRLFYLPFLFVAPLLALPFLALNSAIRTFRRLGIAFSVLALLAWGIAGTAQIRAQFAAAEIVARVRSDLLAIASEPGGQDCFYGVIGVPTEVDHAPTYGTFLGIAFAPPFLDPPIRVRAIQEEGREASLRDRMLFDPSYRFPVRILEWKSEVEGRDPGRLIKLSGMLPPPGGPKPRLELPADRDTIDFATPIRPRDVPTLAIEFEFDFENAPEESFSAELVFDNETEEPVVIVVDLTPEECGMAARYYVELAEREDWLFAQPMKHLTWRSVSGAKIRPVAIDFAAEMPPIELVEAKEVNLSEPDPGIRFQDPGDFRWFRIRVFLQGTTRTFTYPRQRFEKLDDGTLRIRLSSPGFNPGEDPLYLAELNADGRNMLDAKGVIRLPLSYRVEALRGSIAPGASAQAASKIGLTFIAR